MKNKTLIRLSKSHITNKEKSAVINVLNKSYFGMGEEVKIFESELSKFFNNKAICVSSGTAALHLSLLSLGVKKGDEVLVPSLTYVASFQAISATGATPIACDINPNTLLIDLNDLKSKISKKTKVIMPVHYTGDTVNMNQLLKTAKKFKIRIVEDAAHAFGTIYKKKLIGSFGDITCFSFDGIKNITCGEGGCIVTRDKKVIEFVKNARLLGVNKDSHNRYKNKRSWKFKVLDQGWRYHMSNIMAAIGIEQLKRFNIIKTKRRKLAKYYDSLLINNANIKIFHRNYNNIVPHIYVVQIPKKYNTELIRKKLYNKNIACGLHYYPNHLLDYYKKNNKRLIQTEKIYKEIITLPLHPTLTKKEIKYIVRELSNLIN